MPRLTRRTTLCAAAALAAAPTAARAQATPPAPPPDRPLFGAQQWQLTNGLRVVFVENRRAPVVAGVVSRIVQVEPLSVLMARPQLVPP
jgi:hypothetical protein